MTRQLSIRPEVVASQRRASDPQSSVWVRANAGSGKTYVLTERVMRLLLAGVRPEEILCLTYTKAAAAEMRRRVAGRLADWALLPEAELVARLTRLENRPPTTDTLLRARTLFAHALETPGGLKINTIHAFCESVLHRFPLEAGVPFDFAVIEEAEADDLILAAREAVLAEGLRGGTGISPAVETLFELMSDNAIGRAIDAALAEGRKLRHVRDDPGGAKARLRAFLGVPPTETLAALEAELLAATLLEPGDCRQVVELCHGAVGGNRCADYLAAANLARPSLDHLFSAFLVGDEGEPRKSLLPKALRLARPELAERLEAERDRLVVANQRRKAMLIVARSEALLDVLAEIVTRYERQKRARSRLDFDDLIERLGALFADPAQADWVRYKLDAGITHVLVDESQDTNPEQWHVVKQLADEFFVGDSAVERPRTLFAVGDEKQSIYSFQGAEPALFVETGRRYRQAALAVDRRFEEVPLHTSFRTLQGVLEAVDLVFAAPAQQQAVLSGDQPVVHDTARPEAGGTVTLWPPLQDVEPAVDAENWPLEPQEMVKSAARRLAERLAGEIAGWLTAGRRLGARDVAVRPGDILILVQSRSLLFAELIRALGQRNIPTPGADRLAVTGHIAVLDLLALADVLLTPADDLQLAALLRSPLFDISEDDLMALAAGRSGTLWQALPASSLPQAQEAAARLRRWRGELDFDRPFEFYAEILYRDGGLRRFHARLGAEVDDVMAEFLDLALAHEQTQNPSLQGFVAAMRARDVSIRRELAEAAGGVRVMTVHGAKGLEAPIVILADAASTPGSGQSPPVFVMKDAPGPLFVHAANKRQHVPASTALRDAAGAAEAAEYWRKLYVGMTRAEDELYVTGYLTRLGRIEDTWYAAIEAALDSGARRIADAEGRVLAKVFPAAAGDVAAFGVSAALAALPADGPLHLPPLPRPSPIQMVTPSSAYAASDPGRVLATAAESLGDAEQAREAGLALHALLQHLPNVARAERQKIVEKALPVLLPNAPQRHAELARKALAILDNPAFAELFGPTSRAEVPFLLEAKRGGTPIRLAGRIDRMVVAKDRVLVVDYKSDAVPAGTVSEIPASYLTQVGLYAHVASQLFPELGVQAGILWTSLESLMIIPPAALRDAVSAFTMR